MTENTNTRRTWHFASPIGAVMALAACSGPVPMGTNENQGSGPDNPSGSGGGAISLGTASNSGGSGSSGTASASECSNNPTLTAVIRDFRGWTDSKGTKHPDFENGNWVVDRGIVKPDLGADQKPVYAPDGATKTVSGADSFNQWYRDVDGVNMRFEIPLQLSPKATDPSTMVFDSAAFFPLDGKGFGNQTDVQRNAHNYSFTTEIHTKFTYKGGETFKFVGDDDVFAFVNGKQVIDLGGIHVAQTGTVDMDAQADKLNITKGNTYNMDIFHAERHVTQSNFHMETKFDCLVSYIIP